MRKRESARGVKRRGHLVVWSDGPKVTSVKIVELTNKKIDVVRGELIVLLQIIESDDGESGREVPPEDVNRRAGVLGRTNDVHYWSVKGEGWRNVNLYDNQGVVMDSGMPLKVMKGTDEEQRSSEYGV